jgi:hypothetical protein
MRSLYWPSTAAEAEMFTRDERAEIQMLFYDELVHIHAQMQRAGSYRYLCLVNGRPIYAHSPVGKVIWHTPWM